MNKIKDVYIYILDKMCSLQLQTKEIIGRGHHISVYRVHVKLPYVYISLAFSPIS